jgi:hypothetical protein
MLKIKTKTLTNFMKKVRMSGTLKIEETIFDFTEDGLKIVANSISQHARTNGWLKKIAFANYVALGKVGLNDLDNVERAIGRFGEFITIEKHGNLLTLKGDSKKVDIELVNEEFLKTDITEPNLQFTDTFITTALFIKGIFSDVKINKDAIIKIETTDKKVKFMNTGKYKFLNEFACPTVKGGVNVSFGDILIDAIENLDGNLEFSLSTNYPAKIREQTEESIITLIVAPRVEE